MNPYFVGTAAWTVPQNYKELFPPEGSHLERYAQGLNAVEINSSFYRDHKADTYARWAETVPANFRFSVKLSKILTHEKKLEVEVEEIEEKLSALLNLKEKLGCLLIQIPPKLEFRRTVADEFFANLRQCYQGPVAFEPRHETWASQGAEIVLEKYRITQVVADPDAFSGSKMRNREFSGIGYYRLHGSPEIYKSAYEKDALNFFAEQMEIDFAKGLQSCWCIFDNTTFGYATLNALQMKDRLQAHSSRETPLKSLSL